MSQFNSAPFLQSEAQTVPAKHTGKNINATSGSRTARTAKFEPGQLVQIDPQNHEAQTGLVVADVTAGANTKIGVISELPVGSDANSFVAGSTTDRRGGTMEIVMGAGKFCYARVRAVAADIVPGTYLQPGNATGYRCLRDSASTAITNVLSRVVTGGAGRSFAVSHGSATIAETTTAGADKLILIEIID